MFGKKLSQIDKDRELVEKPVRVAYCLKCGDRGFTHRSFFFKMLNFYTVCNCEEGGRLNKRIKAKDEIELRQMISEMSKVSI